MPVKTRLIPIILLLLLAYNCSCQKKALHYVTKDFDVAIFPASVPGLVFRKKEKGTFTPSKQQIDKAELCLNTQLSVNDFIAINKLDSLICKNLKDYRGQYFGYIDSNGHKILYINCFWKKMKTHWNWLRERVAADDCGAAFWQIKYDLDTNKLFDLRVNSWG